MRLSCRKMRLPHWTKLSLDCFDHWTRVGRLDEYITRLAFRRQTRHRINIKSFCEPRVLYALLLVFCYNIVLFNLINFHFQLKFSGRCTYDRRGALNTNDRNTSRCMFLFTSVPNVAIPHRVVWLTIYHLRHIYYKCVITHWTIKHTRNSVSWLELITWSVDAVRFIFLLPSWRQIYNVFLSRDIPQSVSQTAACQFHILYK